MSEDKRKRSPNWLPSEKELLLSLVEQYFNVIENKKIDGASMKKKMDQWQIIADQYNCQTTHCSRLRENLKAQWESMKKVAKKEAANNRNHVIQTGGGSPIPPKKEDYFLQRILSLISNSAVGLFNQYDSDSAVSAVQDQAAVPDVGKEDFPEPPPIQCKDNNIQNTPNIRIIKEEVSDTDVISDTQELITKDWENYSPQLLGSPVSLALKVDNVEKNDYTQQKQTPTHRTWVSRRRPAHTATSSLAQLRKKEIEAIDLQKKLALEEMERSKALHEIDMQIKKEILRQEKIKTNILLIRQKKLMAFKKSKSAT